MFPNVISKTYQKYSQMKVSNEVSWIEFASKNEHLVTRKEFAQTGSLTRISSHKFSSMIFVWFVLKSFDLSDFHQTIASKTNLNLCLGKRCINNSLSRWIQHKNMSQSNFHFITHVLLEKSRCLLNSVFSKNREIFSSISKKVLSKACHDIIRYQRVALYLNLFLKMLCFLWSCFLNKFPQKYSTKASPWNHMHRNKHHFQNLLKHPQWSCRLI